MPLKKIAFTSSTVRTLGSFILAIGASGVTAGFATGSCAVALIHFWSSSERFASGNETFDPSFLIRLTLPPAIPPNFALVVNCPVESVQVRHFASSASAAACLSASAFSDAAFVGFWLAGFCFCESLNNAVDSGRRQTFLEFSLQPLRVNLFKYEDRFLSRPRSCIGMCYSQRRDARTIFSGYQHDHRWGFSQETVCRWCEALHVRRRTHVPALQAFRSD